MANQVTVYHIGPVGAFSHNTARREGVSLPAFFRHGIVIYHRIHISGGDQEGQARLAIDLNALWILPVRLGQDRHAVAVAFQHPPDDRRAERWMIHVGVADDIDKVWLRNASFP